MNAEGDTQATKQVGSKKASSACLLCKKRKRKCSAEVPCNHCHASQQKCVYSVATDGRRKESLNRVRVDSEINQMLFHSLWRKLREGRIDELQPFLKEDISADEFAAYLIDHTRPPSMVARSPATNTTRANKEENESETFSRHLMKSFKSLTSLHRNSLPEGVHSGEGSTANLTFPAIPFATHLQYTSFQTTLPCIIEPRNFRAVNTSITILFTQFRDAGRHAISLGAPEYVVLGPKEVNLDTALQGHSESDLLTPATWADKLQQSYTSLDIYVRVSWIYFISQYLRWSISPTTENFNLLPACMRPTLLQCYKQHHAAIDLCHLPGLRDALIEGDKTQNNDERKDIVVFQMAGLRTNWTGSWNEAVTYHNQYGYRTLTPQFIETISRVDHWIVGRQARDTFDKMDQWMRVADQDIIPVDERSLHQMNTQSQSYYPQIRV